MSPVLPSPCTRLPSMARRLWWKYRMVAPVLAAGLLASLLMFAVLQNWLQRYHTEIMEERVHIVAAHTSDKLTLVLNGIESLKDSFVVAGGFDRAAFDRVAQGVSSRHPELLGLAWAPRVTLDGREAFEQAAAQDGLAGFRITEAGPLGAPAVAGNRQEYFPIYAVMPAAENASAIGFDAASEPLRREALLRARFEQGPIASGRVRFMRGPGEQSGVAVFAPVYSTTLDTAGVVGGGRELLGFAVAVLRVEDLLAAVAGEIPYAGMQLRLTDLSAAEAGRPLLSSSFAAAEGPAPALTAVRTLDFAGRHWQLELALPPARLDNEQWWQPGAAAGSGLFITILLASLQVYRIDGDAVLKASAERFQRIADNSPDIIYRYQLAPALGMEYISPAVGTITGWTPEEFYASPTLAVELAGASVADVAAGAQTGNHEAIPQTVQLRTKDGREVWLEQRAVPVFDGAGQIMAVEGIFRDVTARVQAETAARQADERFHAMIEYNADGILLLDAEGTLLYQTPSITRILGYSLDENLGKNIFTLAHPDEVVREQLLFADLVTGRVQLAQTEVRGLHKNGDWRLLEVTATNLLGKPAVGAVVVNLRDATERQRMQAALEDLALHDTLTRLPNRQLYMDRLQQSLATAARQHTGGVALLLDIDRFKEINDTFGHPAGDAVLKEVAARFARVLRGMDTTARLGGDEFAFVIPGAGDSAAAAKVAARILSAFDEPFLVDGINVSISASIGAALYPLHSNHTDDLMRQADIAMYVAKRTQCGFKLYAPEHDSNDPERLALVTELRRGIEHNELVVYYQPQVSLWSGRTVGAEALVRWQHPQRGLVPPDAFLPLAETSGLISLVTLKVLEQAVGQLAAWERAGLGLMVSVNLAARDFHDAAVPAYVEQLLKEHQIDPAHLRLEIVESTLITDPEEALAIVQRYLELGVSMSIDDFGTGYSSLAYLQRLPVHEVKIDQLFVRQLLTSGRDAAIVRSIIELGHNLGLRVLAEGVETMEIAGELAELGCDLAQGYGFSRPLPAAQFEEWLRVAADI